MHRRVEREVQRSGADAAGQGAAKGFLEISAAERQQGFGIREKEARGQLVLSAAEFAIPIGGELIISVLPWPANCKRNGIGGGAKVRASRAGRGSWQKGSPRIAAPMSTLENRQLKYPRVHAGGSSVRF